MANEATPSDYAGRSAGSVNIIDMDNRTVVATPVSMASPDGRQPHPWQGRCGHGRAGVHRRNHNGRTAYVTLQEANAIGVLDLASKCLFPKSSRPGCWDPRRQANEIDPTTRTTRSNCGQPR